MQLPAPDETKSVLLGDIRGFLSISKPVPGNFHGAAASNRLAAYQAAMLFYNRAMAALEKLETMP